MADYVRDEFTVASDTAIASHTPTGTGTGYTVISDTTVTPPVVEATNDYVEKATLENNTEYVVSAEPDPSSDECFVEGLIVNAPDFLTSSSYAFGFFARRDATDRYMMQLLPASHAQASFQIIKDVSGTPTVLASVNPLQALANDGANELIQFRVTDAKKSIVRQGVEICSTTDNTVTGGDCGFGWGNWFPDGNHVASGWAMDNFRTFDVPQFGLPDSDVSVGSWEDEGAATTNLYQSIDEDTAIETDYVQSNDDPNLSVYEAGLSNPTDPSTGDSHIVHYRARKQGSATLDLRVRLLQGATEIASWTESGMSADWTYYRKELTTTQANNITDYTNLRIELRADIP